MREIVFDTETTGFHANGGDRVTEIGCVEVINYLPTGKTWQSYVNPEREIPQEVVKITGHETPFYRDKPKFAEVAEAFRAFVGDGRLVAHNASFDRGFINAELKRAGHNVFPDTQFFDTLVLARNMFPGASNSLDALCRRMDISLQSREFHGALLDAQLLAQVYLELNGGRETVLDFSSLEENQKQGSQDWIKRDPRKTPLPSQIHDDEKAAHQLLLNELGETAIWHRYSKL
ncbi:DNA polymerase III epsilon subunit [hydrothermal vent metagenome]|uniref:DNA polymerase III subunit epsilon n=1 Tax=hydrothermal vent metagenome TaxID=652676 RepID=A0A3B0RQY6_9ZZZZ